MQLQLSDSELLHRLTSMRTARHQVPHEVREGNSPIQSASRCRRTPSIASCCRSRCRMASLSPSLRPEERRVAAIITFFAVCSPPCDVGREGGTFRGVGARVRGWMGGVGVGRCAGEALQGGLNRGLVEPQTRRPSRRNPPARVAVHAPAQRNEE